MKNSCFKISLRFVLLAVVSCFYLFLSHNIALAEYKAPRPYNFVNDYANVISTPNENKLNSLAEEISSKTGAEIAVVTLVTLDGYPIEDVGLSIGRQWGVGKKDKNNGALIIVAPNEKKLRIEIGYGLEGAIPDSKAGRIRDELMIPEFKKGNIEQGIIYATDEVARLIAEEYRIEITGKYDLPKPQSQRSRSSENAEIIFYIVFFISLTIILDRNKRNGSGLYYGGGFGGSSGGFGGFGGGGFGGGGASGGW